MTHRIAEAVILPLKNFPAYLVVWMRRCADVFNMTRADFEAETIKLAQASVNGQVIMHAPIETTLMLRTVHMFREASLEDAALAATCIDEALVREAQRLKLTKVLVVITPGTETPKDVEVLRCFVRPIPPPESEPKKEAKPAVEVKPASLPDLEKMLSSAPPPTEWVN
jgi:hypothetical protein